MLTGMAGPGPARRLVHEEVIILLCPVCSHIHLCVSLLRMELQYSVRQEQAVPNAVIETETVNDVDDRAAMNQVEVKPILESVSPAEEYYLVSESAFSLVFCSDRSTICLYTHIPVTDFPGKGEGRS